MKTERFFRIGRTLVVVLMALACAGVEECECEEDTYVCCEDTEDGSVAMVNAKHCPVMFRVAEYRCLKSDGAADAKKTDAQGPEGGQVDGPRKDGARLDMIKPDGAKLDLPQPDGPKPDLGKPDMPKPDLFKPDSLKPDLSKPDMPKPDLPKPDLLKPDGPKPDLSKPDLPKPDLPKPDMAKPDMAKPDGGGASTGVVTHLGGTGSDYLQGLAVDAQGNIYIAGRFNSPQITIGSTTLTPVGGYDAFLAKLSSTGQVVWTKAIQGTGDEYVTGLGLDAQGNPVVAGRFSATLKIDSTQATTKGSTDVFVAFFNNAGLLLSMTSGGGIEADKLMGLTVDSTGNIIVVGSIAGTAQFGSTTLNTSGMQDIYIGKVNASGTWSQMSSTGSASDDLANDVTIDPTTGDVIVSGWASGPLTLGGKTYTPTSGVENLLARFTSALVCTKIAFIGNASLASIVVDKAGNIWGAGKWYGTGTVGSTTLTAKGMMDALLVKFNAALAPIMGTLVGGTGMDYADRLDYDAYTGNLLMAGTFEGAVAFGSKTFTSQGYTDAFVAEWDPTAIEGDMTQFGGPDYDYPADLASTAKGTYAGVVFQNSLTKPVSIPSTNGYQALVYRLK